VFDGEESQFEKDAKLSNVKATGKIDEVTIVATAMVMSVAGYDTTGLTISFASYELAKNPDIQERLQEEIDAAFEECNGKMPDYNTILALPYLDMVIHETLRLHTAIGTITRLSINEYTIPGTNVTLEPGEMVGFNVSGIHMDSKYYPNPQTFNPENFSKEAKAERHPYTFLAFGQGPRNCIGMRFALLEAKMCFVSVLRNFTLLPSDKTKEPLQIDPQNKFGYPKDGLWIRAESRNQ
jgi:cytochrome P450 family 6